MGLFTSGGFGCERRLARDGMIQRSGWAGGLKSPLALQIAANFA